MPRLLRDAYEILSIPVLASFLLTDGRIRPEYGLGRLGKLRLVATMYRNTRRIETGISYRAHVAMAAKILSVPPSVRGVIVECGAWKGGTTANLSLVAEIADRTLVVYDSFEGLPEPAPGDRWAHAFGTGAFKGELEEVRDNVGRHGRLDRCEFRQGWFSETLSHHEEPIVAAFLDVDYQDSLHDCVLQLWPHLTKRGWLFIDEYTRLDFCALFFSERWWATHFDRPPPGLLGAGTGIAVGQYFLGPYRDRPKLQAPNSVGLTRKDFYGQWDYVPEGGDPASVPYDAREWTSTARTPDEIAPQQLARMQAESASSE